MMDGKLDAKDIKTLEDAANYLEITAEEIAENGRESDDSALLVGELRDLLKRLCGKEARD